MKTTPLILCLFILTIGLLGCNSMTASEETALPTAVTQATIPQTEPENTATPEIEPATLTPEPTSTSPTETATAVPPTPTETPQPTPTIALPKLNGLSPEDILIMDEGVRENIRQIFANGQEWGRDPTRFSVLGDSTVMNPHLLARFGRDDLILGDFNYLQPTVRNVTTWDRYGVASRNGLHSWSIFDPLWADKDWCTANEDLLSCEFRLNNPTFLIIRLGSNDAGSPSGFEYNVRQAVEHTISNGIIPIIIIKPDRFEGDNTNNEIIRQIAAELQVPLWDLDRVAETLPGKGLADDQIHMREFVGNDFTDPAIFESGHGMQDLSGLIVLHTILQTVQSSEE